jgi:hypothetical protein
LPSDAEKIEKFLSYAEELRVLAGRMVNPEARAIVLTVVEDYERLAATLKTQLARRRPD